MDTESVTHSISEVKEGRKAAFLDLVEQFETRVRMFIAARCPDPHLVDDLTQNVFIHAYQHLDDFEEGTNFLAWVMTIARFKVLAEFKAQSQRAKAHERYVEYVLAVQAVEAAETEGRETEQTREEALQSCYESIDAKPREILDLRYKAGMTIQEICDKLGKTLSWGKSFLSRLKRSLHDCIQSKLTEGA